MQYIIMYALVVMAEVSDVLTGLFKAKRTIGYDSTIMRKGLYSKATNMVVMAFAIACDIGLDLLGQYYDQQGAEHVQQYADIAGAVGAWFIFGSIMLMEAISVMENFAEANPDSTLARLAAIRLKKIAKIFSKKIEEDEDKEE